MMRTCTYFGLLLGLLWSASVSAQQPDPRNAATWYQRAIGQYLALPEAQRDFLTDGWDPTQGPPTAEVRAALRNAQSMLQNLQRGSAQEYCAYDLDRSEGFGLMLPHLSKMRSLAKIARLDVLVRLHDGDGAAAADRLAALYRMGGHNGHDRVIISSLVGQAIFHLADGLTQTALDQGALDAAGSARLLAAAQQLGVNDPFNYLEAVAGEQEMVVDWLARLHADPEGWAEALEPGLLDVADPHVQQLQALDEEQFNAALNQYDVLMGRMVEIFAGGDTAVGQEEIKKLEAEIESGVHGPLVTLLMPALGKCYESKIKGEQMIRDRIAVLERLAAGETKPEELANAAIWYVRGIATLEVIEPAKMDLIRAFAADTSALMSEELATLLASTPIQDVIDVIRDGTTKRRCDFGFVRQRGWGRPHMAPAYAAGMHDALRLIECDAVRLLRAGDQPLGLDRLVIGFSVTAHLGVDIELASARVAHHHFNRAFELTRAALETDLLSPDFKPALFDAVDRHARKDPFGYLTALLETRKLLGDHLWRGRKPPAHAEEGAPDLQREADRVKTWNADQCMFVLAVLQTLWTNSSLDEARAKAYLEQQKIEVVQSLARLDDLFAPAEIEAARAEVPAIAPQIARDDWDLFVDRAPPAIAALASDMQRARGDLRRAIMLVKPLHVEQPAQD